MIDAPVQLPVPIIVGWHLVGPPGILLHNARLTKGYTLSSNALAAISGNDAFVSLYQVLHHDKQKEVLWEQIRKDHFPTAPSRMGAFFMFETKEAAEHHAASGWFKAENRQLVEAWAVNPAMTKTHKADAAWLERPQNDWPDAARSYWQGDMSATPKTEILVQGQLYFPTWESFTLIGGVTPRPAES